MPERVIWPLGRGRKDRGKNGLAFVAAHPSKRGKDGAPCFCGWTKGGPPAQRGLRPIGEGSPYGSSSRICSHAYSGDSFVNSPQSASTFTTLSLCLILTSSIRSSRTRCRSSVLDDFFANARSSAIDESFSFADCTESFKPSMAQLRMTSLSNTK